MFYGVYYYNITFSGSAKVNLVGFYPDIDIAKKKLNLIITNHYKGYNNSVTNGQKVGWINIYDMGDINDKENHTIGVNCCQPHTSINIYNTNNNNNNKIDNILQNI